MNLRYLVAESSTVSFGLRAKLAGLRMTNPMYNIVMTLYITFCSSVELEVKLGEEGRGPRAAMKESFRRKALSSTEVRLEDVKTS
jgi:hypothetical protein